MSGLATVEKENEFAHTPTEDLVRMVGSFPNLRRLVEIIFDQRGGNIFQKSFCEHFDNIWMTDYQTELWQRYCEVVIVPRLSLDMENNRLQMAYGLCFTDARKLPAKVRLRIGLLKKFIQADEEVNNPPELYRSGKEWATQCADAEKYLLGSYETLLGLRPRNHYPPFEFLGCLVGKNLEYINGLCFETTEFANGTVMLSDVWYFLRGPKELILEIAQFPFEGQLAEMPNCGGVWQPTRLFTPENIDLVD